MHRRNAGPLRSSGENEQILQTVRRQTRRVGYGLLLSGLSLGLAREAGASDTPVDLDDLHLEGGVVAARAAAPPGVEDASHGGGSSVVHPPAPKVSWQGLILLHVADGVGVGGQLRVGNMGLRASLAYLPQYFIIDKDPWDDEFARFELAQTAQLNVDAFQLFGQSEKGVSLSYRYSTLLGHGLGLAYQSSVDLGGERFVLSVPVIYYPSGSERVQREFGLQGGERINFPFGPRIDYGIGLAWLF